MKGKFIQEIEDYITGDTIENRQVRLNAWKAKQALRQQRKVLQRRLFGEHFNYSKVGLNKEKKYLVEEQRNTEIQRSNRILLEKIQRIAKRSVPVGNRKQTFTEHDQDILPQFDQKQTIKPRPFQTMASVSKSFQHLERVNNTQSKSVRIQSKVLYQGSKEFQGKLVLIKTYIENNTLTLAVDIGKIRQKIKIDIEAYRNFFKETLEADHSKIIQHLHFNGASIELKGIRKQKIIIQQHEQICLPPISTKPELKESNDKSENTQDN